MTKPANPQSQKRFLESLGQLFTQTGKHSVIFLKSSSDTGVIRNGGRNGARFAPQSLLASFKKMSQTSEFKNFNFKEEEIASIKEEEHNFKEAQDIEAIKIEKLLKDHVGARFIHIGGGHDHIYPMLKALSKDHKQIIVINIDAHADTRDDQEFHSGTPFRQFADSFSGEFYLYQIGLNRYANSFSTLSPLKKGQQDILWREDVSLKAEAFFKKIKTQITDESIVFFSLDADALKGYEIPAVSAVNPEGLSLESLHFLWRLYTELGFKHAPMMGVYELNPLYDSLASYSMRTIAAFIFKTLKNE